MRIKQEIQAISQRRILRLRSAKSAELRSGCFTAINWKISLANEA
jgi:hypothetical protein